MANGKHKLNITIDDSQLFKALTALSKKRKVSVSSLSLALLQRAIELEEDFFFSRVSEERLSKKEKRISHSEAWD